MWLLAALLGCGAQTSALTSTELHVFTFPEYIPAELIDGFEAETGVRITVSTYENNEELFAALDARPGTYDLVFPSDYAVERLVRDDALLPLDLGSIPNYNNVDPAFLTPYFDPGGLTTRRPGVHHHKYSLPYLWGTLGIAYDTTKVSPAPASWSDLWRADLQGHLAVVDDSREMLGIALVMLGHDKNTRNPDQIALATAKLKELAPGIVAYDANTTERQFDEPDVTVAVIFSGNAVLAQQAHPDVAYVLPQGAGIWFDNMAIPKDAPHADAAAAFIDYVLRPESGVVLTRAEPYSNPNQRALELLRTEDEAAWDAYQRNPATHPSPADLAGALIVKDVGPEVSALYEKAWADVKGGR